MSKLVDVIVPDLPESVADATVSTWHVKPGDAVTEGMVVVELETDKVVLEVTAAADGALAEQVESEDAVVIAGAVLGRIDTEAKGASPAAPAADAAAQPEPAPATPASAPSSSSAKAGEAGPAARRAMEEQGVAAGSVQGSGRDGRVTKQDVASAAAAPAPTTASASTSVAPSVPAQGRFEERVPMSRLRKRVAERLKMAQNNAAMLTTFNEVNMKPVMDLRAKYKDQFEKNHDVRLGFMSFFVKATVHALQQFPDVNAFIDGDEIVYHSYHDVGLAVSSPRGLVVPVLRDAETRSMANIEKSIKEFAVRAKTGAITVEEMTGGTFTITNGGVFGSMLSTPILNPPQSAILGMHNIVKRPVVENDEIVIRPMMYLALSYDHRIIDGSTSVRFLYTIKEMLEDPARLLLDV